MRNEFIVHINVRRRAGHFSARSEDLPGLHVAADTPAALRRSAVLAVKTLYKRNQHMDVDVQPETPDAEWFYDAPTSVDRLVVVQRRP